MMRHTVISGITILALVLFFGVLSLFANPKLILNDAQVAEDFIAEVPKETEPIRIVFVGDIMLARSVENLMEENGELYPFLNLHEIVGEHDLLVGNFEGVVTKTHYETPPMAMRFSVREQYLRLLKEQGFDVLSLANNHSADYGIESLGYTRVLCESYELTCIGAPFAPDTYSRRVITVGDMKVGFIALHTLFSDQDTKELYKALLELVEHSDIQIAYVHWGTEYELVHSKAQEMLAKLLIDNGVDAVIGHHPHVVQDVQLYNGKPIFYSLGNFIFDQYFSADVMEGLVLHLELSNDSARYTLIPIESTTTRSQPRLMESEKKKVLLERVLNDIATEQNVASLDGSIRIDR